VKRLFVALEPPAALARELCARTRAALGSGWRVPAPGHLHLTLAFLGDTPEARLAAIGSALAEALRGRAAPELRLTGTGAFPDLRRPRVVWAGLEEPSERAGRLAALRAAVVAALGAAGAPFDDKPFAPHLTVARPRGPRAAVPAAFRELALELAWTPDACLWIESRLGRPAGERYLVLARYPLSA
jgi:RNA 2',3'-cyclic 3'-phosphodiesterase